jgi:hypothetical protein
MSSASERNRLRLTVFPVRASNAIPPSCQTWPMCGGKIGMLKEVHPILREKDPVSLDVPPLVLARTFLSEDKKKNTKRRDEIVWACVDPCLPAVPTIRYLRYGESSGAMHLDFLPRPGAMGGSVPGSIVNATDSTRSG